MTRSSRRRAGSLRAAGRASPLPLRCWARRIRTAVRGRARPQGSALRRRSSPCSAARRGGRRSISAGGPAARGIGGIGREGRRQVRRRSHRVDLFVSVWVSVVINGSLMAH